MDQKWEMRREMLTSKYITKSLDIHKIRC
ncbi:hypothetical protein [Vibrio parahaemolyticus]